ncbi:adenylosuccinate synthase [Candidatus Micrarchaeota archaeon]|nr:adenylosuccinate synthase [Candidatus Micrarchaeota archaeon]
MSVTLILGLQWGDEGKGKIVDMLAKDYEYVVRFNGGDNAGHTVIKGEEVFKLHLVPSAVFYPEKFKVIGNGVVVNPDTLMREIDAAESRGYSMKNLLVSSDAHIILPWHTIMDGGLEESGKIGTTKKGIGPAYSDKASRTFAIRACDLMLPEQDLKEKLAKIASHKKKLFRSLGFPDFDAEALSAALLKSAGRIRPHISDTQFVLNDAIGRNRSILLEGAQGALLDLDHGTFPYVTSSNTTSGAGCTGTGIPPQKIQRIIGIAKAYTTRVGEGPFPTELKDGTGEIIRKVGREFGTTTGRPRRCGWLDLVVLRYTCMINGATEIALTKLDVLGGLREIKVATAYDVGGRETGDFPLDLPRLAKAVPVYETLPGWGEDISSCRSAGELPANARKYVQYIEKKLGVPVKIISVGPKRDETIQA